MNRLYLAITESILMYQYYMEGESVKQISRYSGKSESTVRRRLIKVNLAKTRMNCLPIRK